MVADRRGRGSRRADAIDIRTLAEAAARAAAGTGVVVRSNLVVALDKTVVIHYSMGMFGAQPKGDEPMSTATTRRLSAAETASLVRKALKTAHPGIKFGVRSKTYAGGASIDVSWTDGPTTSQVEATAKLYQGASFDGSTDTQDYHESLLSTEDGAEVVSYGADFVFCHRSLSSEFQAELKNEIAEFTGEPYDPRRSYRAAALSAPGTHEPATLHHSSHETTWGTDLIARLAWNRPKLPTPAA